MPLMYYAYSVFPVYFWNQIMRHRNTLTAGLQLAIRSGWGMFILGFIAFILVMEALVSTNNVK